MLIYDYNGNIILCTCIVQAQVFKHTIIVAIIENKSYIYSFEHPYHSL